MASQTKLRKSNCVEDLRRRILTLELEPGGDLDEAELSGRYGVSRPPLREVLRQLVGEGYVVLHDYRGAQVAPMTHKTLINLFIAAPMVYAVAARLAAERAAPAQIMRLKDAQLLFRRAIRDGGAAERSLANERFHAIIGDMADNDYFAVRLRRLLIDHTRIGMSFYGTSPTSPDEHRDLAADQHDEFIALIEARDADATEKLAVTHWELCRADIESAMRPAGIQAPLGQPIPTAPRKQAS